MNVKRFINQLTPLLLILSLFIVCSLKREKNRPNQPPDSKTVTIDGTKEFQTIEGLGGTEMYLFPTSEEYYSRFFDDLGVSMVRFRMVEYTESPRGGNADEARDNDDADPLYINWNNVATAFLRPGTIANYLQAAQRGGCKIIGDIMSYPLWMKTNGAVNGGSLRAGYEDEAVEFILIWIKGLELFSGVHIDFVSLGNEPEWEHPYEGTVLSQAQMIAMIKKLGARLAADGLTTQIIAPETMDLAGIYGGYGNAIGSDVQALGYLHAFAAHPYNGGGPFFNPDEGIPSYQAVKAYVDGKERPFWMTEYCLAASGIGQKGTWNEAIHLVQHLHNALYYGWATTWLYHELYNDPSNTPIALIDRDNPAAGETIYAKFYALKQYFRYIRPGAVRIDARCSDHNILVTAFSHKTDRTLTIVAINRNSTDESLAGNISGLKDLPDLSVVRTSQNENAVNLGVVPVRGNTFSITLAAHSITTFIGKVSP